MLKSGQPRGCFFAGASGHTVSTLNR